MLALQRELRAAADPEKAAGLQRFFKTGKGEYAEGDQFLGLTVPMVRAAIRPHRSLLFSDIAVLLGSKWHEERLAGLFILVDQFRRGTEEKRSAVSSFYLQHLDAVNNWDLVDTSAYAILGEYLLSQRDFSTLYKLADSGDLWRERVAMVSTLACIRAGDCSPTFALAERFLSHSHDLMHKASGWMLREAGKKDERALRRFLDVHLQHMPRTMLRYAIEKFPESDRQKYLRGND